MKLFLLDAGGAGLVLVALVIFMLIAFVAEALAMMLMKYNNAGKSFLDSLVINLVSLGAGYIVILLNSSLDFTDNETVDFILIFLLTVVVEGITLYLLNQRKPISKTLLVTVVINLITYLVLYIIRSF